jgi:hypothetical protein
MNENENNYWSEYNSKINYLGAKRGPGADLKDFPDRPSYDPLTGVLHIENTILTILK